MKTEHIFAADIEVGDRLRGITPEKVAGLKASIAEIGLRTPITVAASRDGDDWHFRLVAGAHRLAALRSLGTEFVDAYVMEGDDDDAALWEIDENFARAELSDAQRADHHVRREEILVRKKLVSAPGKGGNRQVGDRSYAANASAATGQSKRAVERDIQRGKNIAPDVLAEVAGTDMDKGVVLDALARAPREDQRAVLAEIKEREATAKLTRYADKEVARSNAEEAAEIIHANLDLEQVDALAARLSSVTMKDFLAALSMARAA